MYRWFSAVCFAAIAAISLGACPAGAQQLSPEEEPISQCLHDIIRLAAGENLAFLQRNQTAQLLLGNQQITAQINITNGVRFTFCDINRDKNIFFIRRNRDLR